MRSTRAQSGQTGDRAGGTGGDVGGNGASGRARVSPLDGRRATTTTATPSTPGWSVAAGAAVEAARGAVEVAVAVLAEAVAAAPPGGLRVAVATDEVATACNRAEQLSRVVAAARDAVDDAADELEVLTTEHPEHLGHVEQPNQPGREGLSPEVVSAPRRVVRVEAAIRRQRRVLAAAREDLVVAEETRAAAEVALAAAEEALGMAELAPAMEPAAVVTARVALDAARRALTIAETHQQHEQEQHEEKYERPLPLGAARAASSGGPDAGPGRGGEEGAVVVPYFSGVEAFVESFVLPNWRHGSGAGVRWCRVWWKHPEAVGRFEALWEAFEAMRLEPAPAISTWWLWHFDGHLRALTAADGVFAGCTATERESVHSRRPDWPALPPVPGLFEADPASPQQARRVHPVPVAVPVHPVGGRWEGAPA